MALKYLTKVSTLEFRPDRCTGCGRCVEVCPHAVFSIDDGRARIVDRDACMECGACRNNCAFEALRVNAGVGCASAIIYAMRTGRQPACGCDENGDSPGCC